MERSLRARLRSHRLSADFVDRHAEDALQRGFIEYLRAREAGKEIRDPAGFVVAAAFRRAIDELRREARRADGTEVERLLDMGSGSAPSAEEVVVEESGAAELRIAIEALPAEERQALSLHYFEEESAAGAARLLYCSESTFRRRVHKALADLAELLGAPAPEPGSHRGLEIGLVAWASLGGGRVVVSSSPLDHLAGLFDSLHSLPTRVFGRLRGTGTNVAASEAPERIGVIAAGPGGKVIGGCAGAAVICALSGVVGSGVQLGGSQAGDGAPHAEPEIVAHRRPVSRKPLVVDPRNRPEEQVEPTHETPTPSPEPKAPAPRHKQHSERGSAKKGHRQTASTEERPSEAEQVEEQFSGITQAAAESETAVESTAPATSDSTSVSQAAPAHATAEPEQASAEERRVEEQIRGPLAR
jgi:RNA polymerase sigma-70 factor (ECF subfamily)